MKKIIVLLVVLLIPMNVYSISASSVIVMDMNTGRNLYGYNIHDKRLIASITKIMTAIIAIEKSDINKEIEVTDVINDAYGSGIYIKVGEKIKIKDLIYGLMLRSGNDAALMIAEAVSGSKDEFVYLMNEYASNLKMNNTLFLNPSGLEEKDGSGNESTAYDMAILMKYAMKNKIFREIVKTKKYTLKTSDKTYIWHNKNKLLSHDYITGGKTGFTEKARRTLVTTGSMNNMNIIIVTLNDPDDWKDHEKLYQDIFSKYKNYLLVDKNKFKVDNETYYKNDKLYIKKNINMMLTHEELEKVRLNMSLIKYKKINNDMQVGNVEVIINNKIYHKEPIYIKVKNNKLTLIERFKRWLYK